MEEGGSFKVWGKVGRWTSKLGRRVHGCGLWKGIHVTWEDFSKNTQFVVGIGNRVRFWQDGWCEDQTFQLAFLRLYGIATDKEVSIESSLTMLGVGERRSWDVHFIWDFNNWEMIEGVTFLRILGANNPLMDVGDQMRWKLKPNGNFDIRTFYNNLRGSPSIVLPWKGIWRAKAP